MRAYLNCVTVFLLGLSISIAGHAQVKNIDSMEQKILESVQRQLNHGRLSNPLFDTSKTFSTSPLNLKKFLQDLDKQIEVAKSAGDIGGLGKAYHKLSTADSVRGNYKGAYENYKLYSMYRDSLQKKELEQKELQAQMQRTFDKKQAQQEIDKEKQERKNAARQIFLFAVLIGFITIATISFIAYKREQKGKKLVHTQKNEIENTLSDLRSAQAQLIHSEKMASLGELTAGIAHEIQNPLNFVNNFSEVNNELIEEVKSQRSRLKNEELNEFLENIFLNNEKISHHGKRADAIVKGMLQHSRSNAGKKEPTDINALVDEYVKLAYHGLRAREQNFNVKLESHFDSSVKKMDVVPQDLGRVILNLTSNAFYAVMDKKNTAESGYEPVVTISTKKLGTKTEIRVGDNGGGIPKNIIDKVFQPFFTTKPSGQGTGLGLSMAYDIIKAHGATIQVASTEGEGSEFTITLIGDE